MNSSHASSGPTPVLVLGATGGQGGAVAAALISAGREVRALVRDPDTPPSRRLAAAGAELTTGNFSDVDILTAAARAQLPHLVFSSVAGATDHTDIPHVESKAAVEHRIAASDIAHTVVAPTYFYDRPVHHQEVPLSAVRSASADMI